jgi:hypothetical protein
MRRLCRFLPLLVLGTACEPAPDDPLFYVGRVLHEDGSPWAGAALELQRTPDGVDPYSAEPVFEPWVTVTAGEDGRFVHELRVFDTQLFLDPRRPGYSRSCRIRLPPGADGGRTWLRFAMNRSDAELPTLRPWRSGLRHSLEATRAELSWAPVPPLEDVPAPLYRAVLRGGGAVVWQELLGGTGGSLPTDVGEDVAPLVLSVEARSEGFRSWFPLSGRGGYLAYSLVHESPLIALPPVPVRLPVSRGAPCNLRSRVVEEEGPGSGLPRPGALLAPCPLTDGRFDRVASLVLEEEVGPTVFLSEPRVLRRALLRGMLPREMQWARTAVLEGSAEGETWHLLADLSDRFPRRDEVDPGDPNLDAELYLDVALTPSPVPVRQVRLRTTGYEGQSPPPHNPTLRELSLFD